MGYLAGFLEFLIKIKKQQEAEGKKDLLEFPEVKIEGNKFGDEGEAYIRRALSERPLSEESSFGESSDDDTEMPDAEISDAPKKKIGDSTTKKPSKFPRKRKMIDSSDNEDDMSAPASPLANAEDRFQVSTFASNRPIPDFNYWMVDLKKAMLDSNMTPEEQATVVSGLSENNRGKLTLEMLWIKGQQSSEGYPWQLRNFSDIQKIRDLNR